MRLEQSAAGRTGWGHFKVPEWGQVRVPFPRGYLYEANAPDAAGIAVKDVLRAYGDVAVAHFVDEARTDPALLGRLRLLLSESDG